MYEELKKLAESATPGPWGYDGSYVCPSRVEGGTTYVESWKSVTDCHQPENTKFIAAANPSAVLALIAENNTNACRLEVSEDTLEVIRACLKTAEAEIDQLKEEVALDDKIIADRDRLLNAIPACPVHGACVPHAIEWVEKAMLMIRELKAENEALRKECARLAEDNLALLENPGDAL